MTEKQNAKANESYIRNCYIVQRDGDPDMFRIGTDTFTVHLDGYAIVPVEQLTEAQKSLHKEKDAP